MNKTLRAVLLVGLLMLGAAQQAQATLLTWNLDGITFSDGATATGEIAMDVVANTWSTFHVSTTTGSLPAFTFDNGNSDLYFGGGFGPNNFLLMTSDGSRLFNFSFTTALDGAGGSFMLDTDNSFECLTCDPFRTVSAGSLSSGVPSAMPEPASLALLIPVLGILGWMSRRKEQTARLLKFA